MEMHLKHIPLCANIYDVGRHLQLNYSITIGTIKQTTK